MIQELRKILDDNKDKRVCVCGVGCSGKSTLVKQLPGAIDLDNIVRANLPKEAATRLSLRKNGKTFAGKEQDKAIRTWTGEMHQEWQKYVWKTVKEFQIKPGRPVFSVIPFAHSDLIVYLDIDTKLLFERAKKRGENPEQVIGWVKWLEGMIADAGLPVIRLRLY